MKKLHIIFWNKDNADPVRILDSLREFQSGIELLICSQTDSLSDTLKSKTGEVYHFVEPLTIDYSLGEINIDTLSQRIRNYLSLGYEITLNVTSAGPFECYVAYGVAMIFQNLDIYALGPDGKTIYLGLKPVTSLKDLDDNSKMLILRLGETDQDKGLLYVDINIETKRGYLGKKGKDLAIAKMTERGIITHDVKKMTGAGKRPYLWKLTQKGLDLYNNNYVELKNLERERKTMFENTSNKMKGQW